MKTKQLLVSVVFLLLSFMSPVLAHAGDGDYDHHGMMSGSYAWFGMGFFGWTFMILIVVALVLFIVWLVKQIQEPERKRK
jgi:uncharacterized membrane protein